MNLVFSFNVIAEPDIIALSDKEIAKRQSSVKDSSDLVKKAQRSRDDSEFDKKALETSYNSYLAALDLLPLAPSTEAQRKVVMDSFCRVAIEYAKHLIKSGRIPEGESIAKKVLSEPYNPNYKPAAQLLADLEQHGYFNKSLTPSLAEKNKLTEESLKKAEAFFAAGRSDIAFSCYEKVLLLDPYNIAARKGLEVITNQRSKYYTPSYNETRKRLLSRTDQTWERPARGNRLLDRSTVGVTKTTTSTKDAINRKLTGIIIQKIDLQDATIREVVDYLKQKSRELDTSTDDPQKKGVNIVISLPAPPKSETQPQDQSPTTEITENTKVSLYLNSVPLIVAIQYLAELANIKYNIEPYAISLIHRDENTEELLTREFRVKADFIPLDTDSEASNPQAGNRIATGNKDRIKGERNAKKHLESLGVPFPKGASAQYNPIGNKLIVRNTQGSLDFIGAMVDSEMGMQPVLVEIESKFVEITQNNLKELGFDWLLGPLKILGYQSSGGSRSYGQDTTNSDYLSGFPAGTPNVPDPKDGINNLNSPLTAANRSGIGSSVSSAISASSLDSLLLGIPLGSNAASPGIFGLSGIISNANFQMVIRALNQKKGVDLMSAPKVTTKSGSKATIKIVREFPYPLEFTMASVPKTEGQQGGQGQGQGQGQAAGFQTGGNGGNSTAPLLYQQNPQIVTTSSTVTPTTPTTFTNRDIGVTLEVEPTVDADNYTINLDLSPQVVEFEGFINYGSSIRGPKYTIPTPANPSGIETFIITNNYINQPVFGVRQVKTNVSIWDGQTVSIGGLMREDVQKVEDRVPLLGDIPLAGRLFRSSVEQKIKRNLIIFVTARLMDAQGQPLKQENEDEDIVNPIGLPDDLPQPQVNTRSIPN